MRILLFIGLFLIACDERIVSVPSPPDVIYVDRSSPSLEFNVYGRLLYDGDGYYAILWGDVKNTGLDTLRIVPQAKIYFSDEAMRNDLPVAADLGKMGVFDESGVFLARETILPNETLQHFTESKRFPASQYVNYLFRFLSVD